jgi:glycerophosphoryl diester phosphodiesterase
MTQSTPLPEIIAHRGASQLAPENTLAAVRLGYALGADAVEVDVHLSADGQLMVIHDADTRRTAGGEKWVVKNTDAATLRQLEVGSWKGEQFRGEKIPLLEEVLAEVPEGKQLFIELKGGMELLSPLQQKIAESGSAGGLLLISFNRQLLQAARQRMPALPAYWLLDHWRTHSPQEAIALAKAAGLQGLDVNHRLVDKGLVQKMRENELDLYVYTVNRVKRAKELAALGVRGITTNRPQGLREKMI